MTTIDYLLFILQEANFQSRSILIPEKEFLKVRKDDYELIKKHSKKIILSDGTNEYLIDNLLIQNIIWEENLGKPETHVYSKIFNDLLIYADGLEENQYLEEQDAIWYDKSISNFCQGFNHVKNYCHFKNLKTIRMNKTLEEIPINIVNSFLLLQSNDGKLNQPSFDTVQEMMTYLYSNKNI